MEQPESLPLPLMVPLFFHIIRGGANLTRLSCEGGEKMKGKRSLQGRKDTPIVDSARSADEIVVMPCGGFAFVNWQMSKIQCWKICLCVQGKLAEVTMGHLTSNFNRECPGVQDTKNRHDVGIRDKSCEL